MVPLRDAHEGEHDRGGKGEGERVDDVDLGTVRDRVEQAGGDPADRRHQVVDALGAERSGGRFAQPGVRRLVQADHRRLRPVTAGEQDLLRLGHQRREGRLGHRRRIGERIPVHLLDVRVPRHDVVVDRRGVEHRRLGDRQRRQDGVRIGEVVRAERVEVRLDRTPGGGGSRHDGTSRHGQRPQSAGLRDTAGAAPALPPG